MKRLLFLYLAIFTLLFICGGVTCCNERKGIETNRVESRHEIETVDAAGTTSPRIGGPFSHWLPLYDYQVNLANHGDPGIRGKRWCIQEEDPRTLFGESIWGLQVWRMTEQPDSEVTLVTMTINCQTPDEAEKAFRRLAIRLFGSDPTNERTQTEPKSGEILHLMFNGKGRADYRKATRDAEFRSAIFEDIERNERESRNRETAVTGQLDAKPEDNSAK